MSTTQNGVDKSTANRASQPALFGLASSLLLSPATVRTARCSFQAATWEGVSRRLTHWSAASGRRSAAEQPQSRQMALPDVLVVGQSRHDSLWVRRTVLTLGLDGFAFAGPTATPASFLTMRHSRHYE